MTCHLALDSSFISIIEGDSFFSFFLSPFPFIIDCTGWNSSIRRFPVSSYFMRNEERTMNAGAVLNQEPIQPTSGELELEDGSRFPGYVFGAQRSVAGEVVFNTGMVGYPETLSDPSYTGQILTFTYPLIGNYGIPQSRMIQGFSDVFESEKVQAQGLIISDYSHAYSHWNAANSLDWWLKEHNVVGLFGVDTRKLTKKIRQHGSMLIDLT